MKKRLLSAILSLCMLLTMAPTVAFAADNEGTQEHPWDISADGEGNSVTAYL